LRRHYVLTTPVEVDKFIGDLEQSIDKTRIDFVNQATHDSSRHATWLAPRRMPSRGGGSYGRSHNTRIHHDAVGSMGLSVGEAYNNHEWAQAVEWGTEPHVEIAKKGVMRIKKVIPGYFKGRDINTVPYGVKYETKRPPLEVHKVEHPGTRRFLIYTDTFNRLVGKTIPMLKRIFKNNW
jgi:hypothetical protein